jgi:hypothetical protein
MIFICRDCGSDRIGFDAWVDKDGNVIGGPYDNSLCMDCGCEEINDGDFGPENILEIKEWE